MSADAFHTLPHSSLASAGLGQGGVDVGYGAGGLALAGRDGERLDLPWTTIRKVRVGIEQSKYGPPRYRLTLWTSAAPQPLRLTSLHRDEAAYAGVARTVALRTFNARGKGSIEGGLGWSDALLYPLAFAAIMPVAFVGMVIQNKHPRPGDTLTSALFVVALTLVIETVFAVAFIRPNRPRALAGMAELEGYLPKG